MNHRLLAMCSLGIASVAAALLGVSARAEPPSPAPVGMPEGRDYTFQWWAYGWRGLSPEGTHVLNFQTGHFGMAFDADRLTIRHLGPINHPKAYLEAAAESNDVVFRLPPAELSMEVVVGDRRYRAVRGDFPSRIVECGRFFQRCDVQGLVFEDKEHGKLNATGRLEIGVWPDRLSLILEVTPKEDLPPAQAVLRLAPASGNVLTGPSDNPNVWKAGQTRSVWLAWKPAKGEPDSPNVEILATDIKKQEQTLKVAYDARHDWHYVPVPNAPWSLPNEPDHTERVRVRVKNPGDKPKVVHLLFGKDNASFEGVTGMSAMLRDRDGHPTGIPVQLSKNWHRRDVRLLYEGPWFHGLTMLRLPPSSSVEYEFTTAYGRWGGVPAASHAQLCLIGWGVDQLWNQAAIGSWGESICYDPDVNLNRSMIDDVRPLMVWAMEQNRVKWTWTNNVGGGDFLVYFDAQGKRQYLSRVRTAYSAQCPNLTDVTFAGTTPDGNIAARISVSTPRADDYNRALHRFRYDVLKPTRFARLVFYQMGADKYNDGPPVATIVRGSGGDLRESWQPPKDLPKTDGYLRTGIVCDGPIPWFSLHHTLRHDAKGGAYANRGLIVRAWKARLGGKEIAQPIAAVYRTATQGANVNVELAPPPDLKDLLPGDFVEAEVQFVILPIAADDYYGPNANLRAALANCGDSWKMVAREASGNHLDVNASRGTVHHAYPIVVELDRDQRAEFAVTGGIGYVPLTFTGLKQHRGWQLRQSSGAAWTRVDQSVHGNDYWQSDFDASSGTWRRTYNIPLDSPGDARRTVRFVFERE